jgi:hypothetical protein
MATLLWSLAVALVIAGLVTLARGPIPMGVVLVLAGMLVGPGGVTVLASRLA